MTGAQPTEMEELSGRVLGIIGAYRMGAVLDARELDMKPAPAARAPEPVIVPGEGYVRDGVYHVVS